MKRPILSIFIPFFIGIIIHEYLKINFNLIVFFIFLLYIFYMKIGKKSIILFSALIFSVLFTFLRYPNFHIDQRLQSTGEIYFVKENDFGNTYYVNVENTNFEFFDKNKYQEGDILKINAIIERPRGENNFKTFNKEKYLKSKSIFYSLNPIAISKIGENPRIKYQIREGVSNYYKSNLNKLSFQFVNSMFLGFQGEDEIFTEFKDLGLSHVLAISGLHLSIIIGFLDYLGIYFKLNKRIYSIFIILILIFYGYIIDFPVSLIRALVMYTISTIAIYTNNIRDKINDLILAALICLILNPFQIYSAGFYLSFISIFSITYIHKNMKRIFSNIPEIILISFSIQIGMLPLVLYFFNHINLLSIILNIFIVPIISISLTTSIAFLFIRIRILELLIDGSFIFIEQIIKVFSNIKENFMLINHSWNLTEIAMYYLVLYCIFNYRLIINHIKKNRRVLYLLLIIPILLIKNATIPVAKVNFIDVGQGDAVIIRTKDSDILFDTGGNALAKEYKGESFYKYLMKNGVRKLDAVFISHSDIDHAGNLDYIIDKIEIGNIFSNDSLKYKAKKLKIGHILKFGDLKVTVIAGDEKANTSNDKSLVLLAEIYGEKTLLTGDIENGEKSIKIKDKINYLKVSHHGSKHSTSDEFLSNNNIERAIISSGKNNRYGHPHDDVLKRLLSRNIEIYRTDSDGNIEINITPFTSHIKYYKKKYDIFEILFINLLYF